jgi:hypothetical protein
MKRKSVTLATLDTMAFLALLRFWLWIEWEEFQ